MVYTTTSANQSIQLTPNKEYFAYIETEDGVEDLSGEGILNHTFVNAGEHKVKILFRNGLVSFPNCFGDCKELTSIPSDLFADLPKAIDFSSCFYKCTGLTSIPSNLFANNTRVTTFTNCFNECRGLTSIPNDLFVNNTKVTRFDQCFRNCIGLTSSTPIDNDGTPLYNRSEGKEGYSAVKYGDDCFRSCILMPDYSSIPSDWK